MTAPPTVVPRRPDEPGPDLSDYVLVHRAMTTDLRRMARAVDRLAHGREKNSPQRAAALRDYLAGISAEIRSHHKVEDDDVWPFLVAVAGRRAAELAELSELTTDHHELDPLLDAAGELAGSLAARSDDHRATERLADMLAALSTLLDRHVSDEERDVFPLIRRYVRVRDYRRLQRRFRGSLSLGALRFVVPWVVSHATEQERPRILADAGWSLRLLLRIFGPGFAAQQRLVFGTVEARR